MREHRERGRHIYCTTFRGLIIVFKANVYHAVTQDTKHLALKIYKTSILVFKDRDRYVSGEHRFRRGYSRNPRKMVKLWAEKEMRNLKRLATAGIHCPEPVEVRENILVMGFLGDSAGGSVAVISVFPCRSQHAVQGFTKTQRCRNTHLGIPCAIRGTGVENP